MWGTYCRYPHDICRLYRDIRLHTTIEFTDSLIDTWITSETIQLIKFAMADTSSQVKMQEELTDIIVTTQGLQMPGYNS